MVCLLFAGKGVSRSWRRSPGGVGLGRLLGWSTDAVPSRVMGREAGW